MPALQEHHQAPAVEGPSPLEHEAPKVLHLDARGHLKHPVALPCLRKPWRTEDWDPNGSEAGKASSTMTYITSFILLLSSL